MAQKKQILFTEQRCVCVCLFYGMNLLPFIAAFQNAKYCRARMVLLQNCMRVCVQLFGQYLGKRQRSLQSELVNSDISLQRWCAEPGAWPSLSLIWLFTYPDKTKNKDKTKTLSSSVACQPLVYSQKIVHCHSIKYSEFQLIIPYF